MQYSVYVDINTDEIPGFVQVSMGDDRYGYRGVIRGLATDYEDATRFVVDNIETALRVSRLKVEADEMAEKVEAELDIDK